MTTSFGLFEDSACTIVYSATKLLTHNSSLSDNPQDFDFYLGSADATTKLQASSSPGVDSITLTPTCLLAIWVADTATTVGTSRKPTTPNGYRYVATAVSGDTKTHATTEPTWPTTISNTVVDDQVTWTCTALDHDITEIKLATSSGGLAGATAGAALDCGHTITGGSGNAVHVYMRITNAVTTVSSNSGAPELSLRLNSCTEYAI